MLGHAHMGIFAHEHMRPYMCVRACVHVHMRPCMHACAPMHASCICVFMHPCICSAHMHSCKHAFFETCIHVHMPSSMPPFISMHSHMFASLNAVMPAYMHGEIMKEM